MNKTLALLALGPMLLATGPAAAAMVAPTVLAFDDILAAGDDQGAMPATYAGLGWTDWHIEAYDEFLAKANPGAFNVPANGDGTVNSHYLTNFEDFGSAALTVSVSDDIPFYLVSVDLFSYLDSGSQVDVSGFFSSATTVTIKGLDDLGNRVNDLAVVDLFPGGTTPDTLINVDLMAGFGWSLPVHAVEFTANGGNAPPRFVMDNFAFTPVPLPPALPLFAVAAGLLLGWRGRRLANG